LSSWLLVVVILNDSGFEPLFLGASLANLSAAEAASEHADEVDLC